MLNDIYLIKTGANGFQEVSGLLNSSSGNLQVNGNLEVESFTANEKVFLKNGLSTKIRVISDLDYVEIRGDDNTQLSELSLNGNIPSPCSWRLESGSVQIIDDNNSQLSNLISSGMVFGKIWWDLSFLANAPDWEVQFTLYADEGKGDVIAVGSLSHLDSPTNKIVFYESNSSSLSGQIDFNNQDASDTDAGNVIHNRGIRFTIYSQNGSEAILSGSLYGSGVYSGNDVQLTRDGSESIYGDVNINYTGDDTDIENNLIYSVISALSEDRNILINCPRSFTIALPEASLCLEQEMNIKLLTSGGITGNFLPYNGDSFEADLNYDKLRTKGDAIQLFCDGINNWYILNYYTSPIP